MFRPSLYVRVSRVQGRRAGESRRAGGDDGGGEVYRPLGEGRGAELSEN